ncbi:hypothetical protein ABT039_24100 [Streptomyces lasiicapitis]|uniref:hypothetical protein n=1 Tax=Streptomyces lasiicapitis TaxID=1923961 RepID=UPI003318AFBA
MSQEPEATQAAVRAQLLRHYTETLAALPAELALVRSHPDLPKAVFHGYTAPHDYDPIHDYDWLWEKFSIGYWLLGTTPESCERYFDLVLGVWSDRGWLTGTTGTSRPRSGGAKIPGGYGLGVTQSMNGYLSIVGSTPPFPVDSAAGDPLPDRIDHPSRSDGSDGSDGSVGEGQPAQP